MSVKTNVSVILTSTAIKKILANSAVGPNDLHGSTGFLLLVLKSKIFAVSVFLLKARKGVWKLVTWQQKKGSFSTLRSKFRELVQCPNSQQKGTSSFWENHLSLSSRWK